MFKTLFLTIFIIVYFSACSLKTAPNKYSYNSDEKFPYKLDYNYQITNNLSYEKLYSALNYQYKSWKGVRYKYGGTTKKGVDCSAFVQRTFKDRLKINIPRTTKLQSTIGKEIAMQDIELGDLVFFKTGFKTRHVGIYLGEGKFLHASTKKGVTISRLDSPYYVKHFWKIKRVIN